jgi:Ca2+-binding EF-hand superfamily protein
MKELDKKSIISKFQYLKDKMNYDGFIDLKQLKKILNEFEINLPKDETERLFKMSDKTCSGTLNADELTNLIIKLSKITFPTQTQKFLKIYELIDDDFSGHVTVKEIYKFYQSIGFELEISTTDILRESLGNKIDFCTFLSMFEFKDENMLKF